MQNNITKLFGIQYPIISGGMVWCSGWRLAAAVSEAGGLGLLGAGSMTPELLREHIIKCRKATNKPFGVNLPLIYSRIDEMVDVVIEENVPIIFTSAGNPNTWTSKLKSEGRVVVHVTASSRFAIKAEQAGVDAVVVEGFEAGGHNGKEETTTMVLVPAVKKAVNIPIIAAGGIASGVSVAAAMALGADAVQIGTRFALAKESSAHPDFKTACLSLIEGGTMLTLKNYGAVRMIKNDIYNQLSTIEHTHTPEEVKELVGKGRAKEGIFCGNLTEGFLEIGQVTSTISTVESVQDIFTDIISEYNNIKLEQF